MYNIKQGFWRTYHSIVKIPGQMIYPIIHVHSTVYMSTLFHNLVCFCSFPETSDPNDLVTKFDLPRELHLAVQKDWSCRKGCGYWRRKPESHYIYLEPVCPLFLGFNPPKQGRNSNKKTRVIWVPEIELMEEDFHWLPCPGMQFMYMCFVLSFMDVGSKSLDLDLIQIGLT